MDDKTYTQADVDKITAGADEKIQAAKNAAIQELTKQLKNLNATWYDHLQRKGLSTIANELHAIQEAAAAETVQRVANG